MIVWVTSVVLNWFGIPDMHKAVLVFDDQCRFCQRAVGVVRALNGLGWVSIKGQSDITDSDCKKWAVTRDAIKDFFVISLSSGQYSTGFYGYRRLALYLPLAWIVLPLLFVPPVPQVGQRVYQWVAANRYKMGCSDTCQMPKSAKKDATWLKGDVRIEGKHFCWDR